MNERARKRRQKLLVCGATLRTARRTIMISPWGVESQTFRFKFKTRKCSQLHSLRCMKRVGYKQLKFSSAVEFCLMDLNERWSVRTVP